MPSVTRRPRTISREERRAEVERKLLDATERLLADGTPYTELSVERLASEAGIARSTFYVYFADKSELVIRLGLAMLEQFAEAASVWWQLGPGASRAQMLVAMRGVVDVYASHSALAGALRETAAYDARIRRVQEEAIAHYEQPVTKLIERGKADGTVRAVNTAETVAAFTAMLEGACYRLARDASDEELDRVAAALTSIVWHALYPDGEATGEDGAAR